MSIVNKLLILPSTVEHEGIVFVLNIFKNGGELRLCYDVSYVNVGSPHKNKWEEFGCWNNIFLDSNTGFLYLVEGIQTDEELEEAINRTKAFLTKNKLI